MYAKHNRNRHTCTFIQLLTIIKKSIMNLKSTFLILFLSFSFSAFSQIKIWDHELKSYKAKGIISKLETPTTKPITKSNQKSLGVVGAGTVAGILIPYVIKYGNSALKKATSKKEADYKFETTYLNHQAFSFDALSDSIVQIEAKQIFYKKISTQ